VRILWLSTALLTVASCMPPGPVADASPPPLAEQREQMMLPTSPPVALIPPSPPPLAAAAPPVRVPPPPPPMVAPAVPAAPPPQVAALPPFLGPWTPEPSSGRLTLSNFSFDVAHVEAVVTNSPDCAIRSEGDVPSDFRLPLNGTRIITARPGADVCWRRQLEADEVPENKGDGWTGWNRVFLASAITGTSRL